MPIHRTFTPNACVVFLRSVACARNKNLALGWRAEPVCIQRDMMAENKRAHQRVRTLLAGRIVFNERRSLIDCTVKDLSEGGARIEFATPFEPPAEFELEVPSKQLAVWARRMWSGGAVHGVMFFGRSSAGQMAPLSDVKAARLQRILEEARREIARTVGVPVERVNLSLDVTGLTAA